ncbi:MAG: hypothetical protein H7249_09435 [Chitinophagaceae bacterium]|nr:hypothetical protein [Oligoflexus sp.]
MRLYSTAALSTITGVSLALTVLGIVGCNSGGGGLQGSAGSKSGMSSASSQSPAGDPAVYHSGDGNGVDSSGNALPQAPDAGSELDKKGIVPPSVITGAYLQCMKEVDETNKVATTVSCNLLSTETNKIFTITDLYAAPVFGFAPNGSTLSVSQTVLSEKEYWNVKYHIVAKSSDQLRNEIGMISFSFTGLNRKSNASESLAKKVVYTDKKFDLTIKTQHVHTVGSGANSKDYCMDTNLQDESNGSHSQNSVTVCNGSVAQDWFITDDSKISTIGGICASFNEPSSGGNTNYMEHFRECTDPFTKQFDFDFTTGIIKVRNSNNLCMALINLFASGDTIDYVGQETCDATKSSQKWTVSPTIRP